MSQSKIKVEHIEIIDQAVKEAFGHSSWASDGSLLGGLSTSILYKLSIEGREYVVRLSDPQDPHQNLEHEYQAMTLAAQAGIAPRLYHQDPKRGVVLMDFIAAEPLSPMLFREPEQVQHFARLIRGLHNGPQFQRDKSIFEKTETIYDLMPPYLRRAPLVTQGMTIKRQLEQQLDDAADMKPSHCDINPKNLLFDGQRLWLVDWGSASQENFYFDLASCGTFFFYQSAEAERAFLSAYFGREPTAREVAKYNLMKAFVEIYYGIMFIYISGRLHAPLLPQEEIDALPDYATFMALIGAGKENLADTRSQQRLGFVYLKRALAGRDA